MDPITIGALISAGSNLLGGLLGNNQRPVNTGGVQQGNVDAYNAGTPYAKEGYDTIKNIGSYTPPVNWGSQPSFSAPKPTNFGSNTQNTTPLNQSGAFSNITPYDPRAALATAGGAPNTTGTWANVQPYDPQAIFANIVPPSLDEMLSKGLISESAFEQIKIDPKLRALQMRALYKLEEIAQNDGMTIQDKVRLRESMDAIARQQRMQRYAIQQSFEARGLSGSGVEIAMTLAAHQGEVEGLSMAGAETAAAGEKRSLDATMQAGTMAGQIAQQDFQREATIAQAKDAIATFNASMTVNALNQNFKNQMELGGAKAQAGQQAFANWMDVVKAKESAAYKSYEYRFQQASAYANAGQQWFSNSMNVLQAQYSANQAAYENYFTWARATDDYAIQAYDANFRAVKSEYDSYMQKLQLQEGSAQFRYNANTSLAGMKAGAATSYANWMASKPVVSGTSQVGTSAVGKPLSAAAGSIIGGTLMGPVGAIGGALSGVRDFVGGIFGSSGPRPMTPEQKAAWDQQVKQNPSLAWLSQ